jgi:hypothetical protein
MRSTQSIVLILVPLTLIYLGFRGCGSGYSGGSYYRTRTFWGGGGGGSYYRSGSGYRSGGGDASHSSVSRGGFGSHGSPSGS